MAECIVTTRKWGNSIGITLPKDIVEKENIHENEKLRVLVIRDKTPLKKMFGMLKGKLKKPTQQVMDELRVELY